MKNLQKALHPKVFGTLLAVALSTTVFAAGPKVVSGPGANPDCFKPQAADTKFFQWPAKQGPYRIALVNGFIANDWRVQMIRVAKAYVAQPAVQKDIKEFKVVSVGQDIAAQIAAANNFIDQGFDAIIIDANSSAAFKGVVHKANEKGVVVVSFDNVIDSPDQISVNVNQLGLGEIAANFLLKEGKKTGDLTFLHVRGPSGQPVDLARDKGFHGVLDKSGRKVKVVDVIGNWAPGDAQKATADAIAAGGVFDGIYVQGGSQGTVQAMLDANKFKAPISGETENAFRMLCNKASLTCQSGGTGPAQSAVAIKTAISALQGKTMPQSIALPTSIDYSPFTPGKNVFPDLPGSFFAGNDFPSCNIGFSAQEIAKQSSQNN
ncbi:substrate-binding domain-containing protein [Paraburkholderia rhizosphaerae]|uniref:Monosaccharide ABC transporter substrate-binding protein (CUT2 family) n=1 Tax=Paraburkholderia rhizosphaerae TaxID=480658 RepID=A0A4R8LZL7_9BURK|nr:substrate-binding domain-containing protein [Paraburkholderia rhizosphaerae]TDY54137.1 monosaccharide ABC transporter substrate-binding protein (CUT2 family) [Paraburkholderia rhizosphaerae]